MVHNDGGYQKVTNDGYQFFTVRKQVPRMGSSPMMVIKMINNHHYNGHEGVGFKT